MMIMEKIKIKDLPTIESFIPLIKNIYVNLIKLINI